jgi:hypothetical protein
MKATQQATERATGETTASNYSREDFNRMARSGARERGYARHRWSLRISERGVTLVVVCYAPSGLAAEVFRIAL